MKKPTKLRRPASRRKPARPAAPRPVRPAPEVSFEQTIVAAMQGSVSDALFIPACMHAAQSVMGAAEIAIASMGRPGAEPAFHTSSGLKGELVPTLARPGPLADCLRSGRAVSRTLGRKVDARRRHDTVAARSGFAGYVCAPLRSTAGDFVAAAVLYFVKPVRLAEKARLFEARVARLLSAALAANATSVTHVAPNQFSSLASAIPGVVYQRIVRPDGDIRYTYLSEGAREMFGVDPAEVVKDPDVLFRTYSEDYRRTFRDRLVEASKTLTKWDVEATVVLPDGRLRTTHAIARPESLGDGNVLWTGVILDASRAKEAEDKLKAANQEVLQANKAKSAFLAKMSHEMRTPLNGILGMGDLLLKTELSPRQKRLASTLHESARSLLGIINDVLDLSRIESGHFTLDIQGFNLHHCVEDALELCATNGYRKGLEVNLIIAPEVPISVKSDPMRLRQILINLLGNAIKFTEAGEIVVRVTVGAERGGNAEVHFEVSDTGIGIGADAVKRLFEPFAQADSTISRRFGGTGLGLSITRYLVELLGGNISLTSELGRGTKVRFAIPFEVRAASETTTVLGQIKFDGRRILVVDDRQTNRETLIAKFASTGARVETASSEMQALGFLSAGVAAGDPYALMVVDRVEPRCSGLHLCRTVRCNPLFSGTALLALMSLNWSANPAEAGLENTTFLTKPVRRSDLLASAAKLLRPDLSVIVPAHHGVAAHPTSVAPSLKMRVLLVEDNQTNIEVAMEYLNELDCSVVVALNGLEAVAAFGRSKFDVVLMDMQMPVLDGLSAVRRIRENERTGAVGRTPIVMVTANAYESDRIEAIEAGADDFMSKPFDDTQLQAMLSKWARSPGPSEANTGGTDGPAHASSGAVRTEPGALPPPDLTDDGSNRFDRTMQTSMLQKRPQFLARVLRAFLSSVPETQLALQNAGAQDDTEQLRAAVHSLKSASANVGAKYLAEQCRQLDARLRLGVGLSECRPQLSLVLKELKLAERGLEALLATAGAASLSDRVAG